MTFYLNQATNLLVRSIGLNSTVATLTGKARDTLVLDVWFFDGEAPQSLAVDSELVFVVKASEAMAAAQYAIVNDWTLVEPGHYRGLLSLNTVAITTAIGDLKSLVGVGELSWNQGSGWESSNTLNVTIRNDVYKGTEGTPLEEAAPAAWLLGSTAPVQAVAASNVLNMAGGGIEVGDAISIGLLGYQFVAIADDPYLVKVGATDSDTLDNLIAAINGAAGAGTLYGEGTEVNTQVTAAAGAGVTMELTAIVPGVAGNLIETGAYLTGGVGFATDFLTGGLGATLAPPYLRVAGGFLHVQEGGVWKKAALSAI